MDELVISFVGIFAMLFIAFWVCLCMEVSDV